jgi:hypothetical protein
LAPGLLVVLELSLHVTQDLEHSLKISARQDLVFYVVWSQILFRVASLTMRLNAWWEGWAWVSLVHASLHLIVDQLHDPGEMISLL